MFSINPLFAHTKLTPQGVAETNNVAILFTALFDELKLLCDTDSREFGQVKSKLEEACFYAKKAVAQIPDNQAIRLPTNKMDRQDD